MGGGATAGQGGQPGARCGKKLIRDIRRVLDGAGVPASGGPCPGQQSCGRLADSDDPCRGCRFRSGDGDNTDVHFALFLADFIETFSPGPEKIGWREYDIYRACLQARQEQLEENNRRAVQAVRGYTGQMRRL